MDPRSTRPPQPGPAMLYPPLGHHVFRQMPGQQMSDVQPSAIGETTPILSHSYFNPVANIQTTVFFAQNHVPAAAGSSAPVAKPDQSVPPQPPQAQQHDRCDYRYVNPKQLHRILKRREARQKLIEEIGRPVRGPYFNESRHNHAKTRPRGPGGKFLRKEEYKQRKKERFNDESKKEAVMGGNGAEANTNQFPKPAGSLFAPIPCGVDQFLTSDGLAAMAEDTAPGQQRVHGDTYPYTHGTPTTSDSSAITAEIQDFDEFSLVVGSRSPLPPRQEWLSSIGSWQSTTPAVDPLFHDGIPLPSQAANKRIPLALLRAQNSCGPSLSS